MDIKLSKSAVKHLQRIDVNVRAKIKQIDEPMPDELEAINRGIEEYKCGEYINADDFDWDAPEQ